MSDTSAPVRRTDEDIATLKRSYLEDPCFDIEDTEGFEAHHDELLAWSEEQKARWETEDLRALEQIAAREGVSIGDARELRSAERAEERAMESAVGMVRHLFRSAGLASYMDDHADFQSLVHSIVEVAERRIAQSIIRTLAKRAKV